MTCFNEKYYIYYVIFFSGHFVLNLVCRDKSIQEKVMDRLKQHFKHIASIKLYEEVNEIIFATNSNTAYYIDLLETAAKSLNFTARDQNLVKSKCVGLKDFLQSITIIT